MDLISIVKEIWRRINVIDSLRSENSAMKTLYLRVAEMNEKWSHRVMKRYYKCKNQIADVHRGEGILDLTHNSGHYA